MEIDDLRKKIWWNFLDWDIKELVGESILLLEVSSKVDEKFHDYSFIVFPAAKAYEGFLKKAFLKLGFITEEDYLGKHFRIGKSLNPSLDTRFREREGVYDKIADFCGGKELANELWETWRSCRNLLFHWFPNEKNAISYKEAEDRLNTVFKTMDRMYIDCKIGNIK